MTDTTVADRTGKPSLLPGLRRSSRKPAADLATHPTPARNPANPDNTAPGGPACDDSARRVVEWFGLSDAAPPGFASPPGELVRSAVPGAGQVTLLVGGSGSGKSTLLRAVASAYTAGPVLDPRRLLARRLARRVIDLFPHTPVEQAVALLAWTGLGEPAALLRPAATLSDGERFRLSVALALHAASRSPTPPLLLVDEFTSTLDDGSAVACARTLRRAVSRSALAAALATWREDLLPDLQPDTLVRCDYGLWEVTRPGEPLNDTPSDPAAPLDITATATSAAAAPVPRSG